MKKGIFIGIILILGICKCNAQLFGTIEPAFARVGFAYNQPIVKSFGIYTHSWYGTIKKELEQSRFSTTNFKVGVGFSYHFKDDYSILVGINKSYYFNTKFEGFPLVDMSLIHKVSFEIGCSTKINRITFLMMSDFMNWESMIGISYQLKK